MFMQRRLKYKLVLPFFVVMLSCGSEWISDPIDPRLPMYTENGNNVAGAFVNGVLWEARDGGSLLQDYSIPRFDYFTDEDSLVIEFKDIVFVLQNIEIENIDGLASYAGRKFSIESGSNGVYFGGLEYRDCEVSGIGQFYLRTVKNKKSGMIMAGTFSFTIDHPNCGRIEVTHGRFDFRIN